MAVYRVNKNRSYTVMANFHLRDKNLSLKAVGLLSLRCSHSMTAGSSPLAAYLRSARKVPMLSSQLSRNLRNTGISSDIDNGMIKDE